MINIIEQIKPLLSFETNDDYYFLQILRRKKDNPDNESNSTIIKSYYIKNIEYLEKKYDEIIKLCDMFNARASLRLNKRSFRKTSLMAMEIMLKNGIMEGWEFSRRAYDSAAGKHHNDKNKKWIVDIDNNPSYDTINEFKSFISECEPIGNKIIDILKTKSGAHIITKPFNTKKFCDKFPGIDIHKDNPVNLYIP